MKQLIAAACVAWAMTASAKAWVPTLWWVDSPAMSTVWMPCSRVVSQALWMAAADAVAALFPHQEGCKDSKVVFRWLQQEEMGSRCGLTSKVFTLG